MKSDDRQSLKAFEGSYKDQGLKALGHIGGTLLVVAFVSVVVIFFESEPAESAAGILAHIDGLLLALTIAVIGHGFITMHQGYSSG